MSRNRIIISTKLKMIIKKHIKNM